MIRLFKFLPVTIIYALSVICIILFTNGLILAISLTVLTILFSIFQFFGAYLIGLNFHINSVNSLDTIDKKVMLTFDDGPCESTISVLEILKKNQVNALFFLIGKNINNNEYIVKQIIDDGHSIGNHSFSHHFWFDIWSTKKVITDIAQCQEIIEKYQPNKNLFRPPYGVTNPNIARALKKLGLKSIGWNIRSYDTSIKDIEKINARILSQLKPGGIILLHDRLDFMPELLEKLIPAIKQKGYEFTSQI
jgi:peptidoglycan/xylan/chitin deacetylase (PgdA/CDA1 family)